jgi:hypothetical protein
LEQGGTGSAEKAQSIRDQARKMGMPVPDPINDRPELMLGLQFYWYAFWELSSDRQIGMSEGPIPWSSMDRWCRRHGINGDEFDRFILMMKHMDSEYMKHRAKSNKKSIAKANPKNPNNKDKEFIKTKRK